MTQAEIDITYMQRCNQLALMAQGHTYPNPMVGSVIVHNGAIIGEGYHQKAGMPHAEVNAINSVDNHAWLKESTLYVNLEPCAHFGRTPPCSNLIIDKQIARVVVGCIDSFSEVSGKGIERMKQAGIDVTVGVLEDECKELNRRFFTFHEKRRPYILLKWAQTLDGFIDVDEQTRQHGYPTIITNEFARRNVHKMRTIEQSIMVGTQTALNDNPSLTARYWHGNQPLRVVIDKTLKLPPTLHLFDNEHPTLVVTYHEKPSEKNTTYLTVSPETDLMPQLFEYLYSQGIQSIIVEGGAILLNSLIDKQLWDEAHVYIGPCWFDKGVKAPAINGVLIGKDDFDESKLFVYRNKIRR